MCIKLEVRNLSFSYIADKTDNEGFYKATRNNLQGLQEIGVSWRPRGFCASKRLTSTTGLRDADGSLYSNLFFQAIYQ